MRPFEILLSIANLLAFIALAAPLSAVTSWLHFLVPVALLATGAQVLLEGPRVQMMPAYLLAGLFFLIWLLQKFAPAFWSAGHRWAYGVDIGLGVLVLAISIALPAIFPVFRFPKPSGPNEIGTLTYHWVDTHRPEIFTTDSNDHRELMVQIWYPARGDSTSPRAPYVQDADALTKAFSQLHNLPEFLFKNLKYVTNNAIPSAPVADGETNYPVLIFLEGVTGFRQMNTFQVEELVSHGYIVVAIDQPYAAAAVVVFPDGRQAVMPTYEQIRPLIRQSYLPADHAPELDGQPLEEGIIPYLAEDVLFTLDQLAALNHADPNGILTRRLDLRRIGTFGVSGGGIVAGEVCRLVPDIEACLFLDAAMTTRVVQSGLQQPGMWITRDAEVMRLEREQAGGWAEDEIEAHLTSMRAVYDTLPGDGYFVQVDGIFHIDFTDVPYWSPLFSWIGATGPIETQRGFDILNAYSLAFFDRHLMGKSAPLLDGLSDEYPEVLLETHPP